MTVVRIGLAPRAVGLSRAEAQRHWRTAHAELFAMLPGLLSYVQNHALLGDDGEPLLGHGDADVYAEVEFPSAGDFDAVACSAHYRESILDDETKLLDASRRTFLMTRRLVLHGTPGPDALKLSLFLGGPSEGTSSARRERWLDDERVRAPDARCVVAFLVDEVGGPVESPADLVLQRFVGSVDEAFDAYRHACSQWRSAARDGLALHAAMLSREVVIVPRRGVNFSGASA